MNTPRPRPALRRADDAEVHPALSIAPSQAPPTVLAARAADPARSEPEQKKGKEKPFRGAGKATSDVWRSGGNKDKPVRLQVSVPKRVRKQLRAVAKESDSSLDDLVTEILTTWLGDPRRW